MPDDQECEALEAEMARFGDGQMLPIQWVKGFERGWFGRKKYVAALAAREEPQGEDALCECGHTAHMHSALVATPGGRTQAPQGTGWCEETREDASSCGCEKFRGTEEPPDQGTGKFGDPYMTSDGSDDPNRASAEAEGALLTPEEVEKVKEWPDDAVERVAIYLSGGDLVSWRERADHSQHPGDTDGKDQFRRDARKLLAVLAAREEPPANCPEDEWHTRAEHEHGLHNETPVAACPLCDPLITGIAAREDTERPSIIPGDHPETRKLAAMMREDTERQECESCNRVFPLSVIDFRRGGKALCPECREDADRPACPNCGSLLRPHQPSGCHLGQSGDVRDTEQEHEPS